MSELTQEETQRIKDVCNAIGPSLQQAISEGVFIALNDIERKRAKHTVAGIAVNSPDAEYANMERALWIRAYARAIANNSMNGSEFFVSCADKAVLQFNKRFPK